MNKSLYGKYIKNQIEVSDMTRNEFNLFMLEYYADYKKRDGKMSFKEFIQYCDEFIF